MKVGPSKAQSRRRPGGTETVRANDGRLVVGYGALVTLDGSRVTPPVTQKMRLETVIAWLSSSSTPGGLMSLPRAPVDISAVGCVGHYGS